MSAFTTLMSNIFGTVLGKIPVRGTLSTPSGGETFPIAICNEIMGGPFIVKNTDELKSIPRERLLKGCKCTVCEFKVGDVTYPMTTYQLASMPEPEDYTLDADNINYVLIDMNTFWILDRAKQAESGTLQYQYSDNYNNKIPLFSPADIKPQAYQDGYATTAAFDAHDVSKIIWVGEYDASIHKWVRQKYGAEADWGIPTSIAQDYAEGDYIDVRYNWVLNGETPATPPSLLNDVVNNDPPGWAGTPVTPEGVTYKDYINSYTLWEISATKDGFWNLKSPWTKPRIVSTDPDLVRYGQDYKASLEDSNVDFQNGTYWHFFYEPDDIFKASRPNTSSTEWTIEKIDQESGEYTDFVFKEFQIGIDPRPEDDPTAAPTTVLGYGINGWMDVPFTPSIGYDLYGSKCTKYSNGTQATPWCRPYKYNGDSTVRAVITPTGNGEVVFKYLVDKGVKTVSPASIGLTITLYDGSTLVSLSDISSISWYKNSSLMSDITESINVFPGDVNKSEVYSIAVTYRGKIYKDQITLQDATDGIGYVVSIYGTTGFTYKGTKPKTFEARIYENGVDILNTSTVLSFSWLLNDVVQTVGLGSGNKSITIPATSVVGIGSLKLIVTLNAGTPQAVSYNCTETLTDVVDGVSLVRYYTTQEQQPNPLTPPNGTLPITGIGGSDITSTVWTSSSVGAIWVVERPSNVTVWNASYRVKGEKGTPNGGFQKTVYLKQLSAIPAPGKPTANTGQGDLLTPAGWSDVPPESINPDETTYGSQAMFTKNPGNNNMELIVANWTITTGGWSTPFKLTTSFTGGIGPAGTNGTNGWTPQINLYPFTNGTILHKIVNWVGGSGPMPAKNQYILPTGLSADPSESGNIRGAKGADGVFKASDFWDGNIYKVFGSDSTESWDIRFRKGKNGVVYYSGRAYRGNSTAGIRVIKLSQYFIPFIPTSDLAAGTGNPILAVLTGIHNNGSDSGDDSSYDNMFILRAYITATPDYFLQFKTAPGFTTIVNGCYNTSSVVDGYFNF